MQNILLSASRLGSRLLNTGTVPALSQCLAGGLSAPSAQRLPACVPAIFSSFASSSPAGGSNAMALSTSSCASADGNALDAASTSSSLRPIASRSAPALHIDGSRRADPGEARYTAPYWIPEDVRREHRLPNVLFTNPWPSHDEPELRRQHARLCLEQLRRAGRPLTAEEIREAVNAEQRELYGDAAPQLATPAYAKQLLEHMRRTRLLFGRKNPESLLSAGHPDHPRFYVLLPYQAARMGQPEQLAAEDAAKREAAVKKAVRRLRNSKPPFAIHRRRAHFSMWQHELANEAIRDAVQSA
ncbi:hypothetical protein Agub_g15545 [Astrephomene gubernaculifera]|uniref:Uncharacterized protein n=1 Tax=Astrephomene gubernaculifera TaxID=47775 RepID=A0AAD3E383_9CHLO|nr:hypothetical protein Agub_g15545 [Astrephomene gubernaculifera]